MPVGALSQVPAGPCAVRDPTHVRTHLGWEPGDPATARPASRRGPHREVSGRTPMMHDGGKSDGPIVPGKFPNKGFSIGTAQVVRTGCLRRGWRKGGQLRGIDKRVAATGHGAGVDGCHGLSRRYGGGDFRLFMLFPSSRHHPRQEPSAVIPLAGICAGGGPKGSSLPRLLTR